MTNQYLSRRERTRKRRRSVRRVLALTIAVIGGILIYHAIPPQNPILLSPLPTGYTAADSFILNIFTNTQAVPTEEALTAQIQELVDSRWTDYSILVVDLSGDTIVDIRSSRVFEAASVNKVPILAVLMYEVQRDILDLSSTYTLEEDHVQAYGTGSIQADPIGTIYTIEELAERMIRESDNTAAHVLNQYIIGASTTQARIEDWELTRTHIANNTTTNQDMFVLFESIYTGNIANRTHTDQMLTMLTDSAFEDRLPRLLPEYTVVYHKIGTEAGIVHDVGIVETDTTSYYIGILTRDDDPQERIKSDIARVSRMVYDYMAQSTQ